MEASAPYSSDVAFTPSVKAQQRLRGSRGVYEQMERSGSWETVIPQDIKSFIEAQTSIFLATANSAGQPYIQHRGGAAGFLRVLDERTLGFADFAGNRQYISIGNLSDNSKVHLFLIDYATRHRVKIWGEARAVENDAELTARLKPQNYKARVERVILIRVAAWDANCRQHIPPRLEANDVAAALAERDQRIAVLEPNLHKFVAPRSGGRPNLRPFPPVASGWCGRMT
jgi:uncharacterized protein